MHFSPFQEVFPVFISYFPIHGLWRVGRSHLGTAATPSKAVSGPIPNQAHYWPGLFGSPAPSVTAVVPVAPKGAFDNTNFGSFLGVSPYRLPAPQQRGRPVMPQRGYPDYHRRWPAAAAPFWSWLAGYLDGSGSLRLQRGKVLTLRLGGGSSEWPVLHWVRQQLGNRGGIYPTGTAAGGFEYLLTHRISVALVLLRLNGLLRNPERLRQYAVLCAAVGLGPYTTDTTDTIDIADTTDITDTADPADGWYAGYYLSKGSMGFSGAHYRSLRLSVSNRDRNPLHCFSRRWGGAVYPRQSPPPLSSISSFWASAQSKTVQTFANYYAGVAPPGDPKSTRLALVGVFHALVQPRKDFETSPEPQIRKLTRFRRHWVFLERHPGGLMGLVQVSGSLEVAHPKRGRGAAHRRDHTGLPCFIAGL